MHFDCKRVGITIDGQTDRRTDGQTIQLLDAPADLSGRGHKNKWSPVVAFDIKLEWLASLCVVCKACMCRCDYRTDRHWIKLSLCKQNTPSIPLLSRAVVVLWLSSWLAEQEVQGWIPGLAAMISEIGYRLLPSRNMAKISLKHPKSSKQTNQQPYAKQRWG